MTGDQDPQPGMVIAALAFVGDAVRNTATRLQALERLRAVVRQTAIGNAKTMSLPDNPPSLTSAPHIRFFVDVELEEYTTRKQRSLGVSIVIYPDGLVWVAHPSIEWQDAPNPGSAPAADWDTVDVDELREPASSFFAHLPQFCDLVLATYEAAVARYLVGSSRAAR